VHSKLKLSHHKYTGRLRPHEHTSYLPLALFVAIVGVVLISFSLSTHVFASPGPQSGSIGLTGDVPGKPPSVSATITTPSDGQQFSTTPITVSGTCPVNTLVEIYKNNIFAGSTPCTSSGSFTIQIDLLYGENSITAQVYDALNQAGPVSSAINVFYNGTPLQAAGISPLNLSGSQLLLITNSVYRGTFPGQSLNVPISIVGGIAPYAVNVQWGDSSNKVIPVSNNSTFNATHTYQKPGTYQITLQGSDSEQQVAFLTVAAIVNGQPSVIAAANASNVSKSGLNKLLVLWPLFAIAVTLLVSFWFGERREKRILSVTKQPPLGTTPIPSA
jgi:hypothetical protein